MTFQTDKITYQDAINLEKIQPRLKLLNITTLLARMP